MPADSFSHSILPSFSSWLILLGWPLLMILRRSQDGVTCSHMPILEREKDSRKCSFPPQVSLVTMTSWASFVETSQLTREAVLPCWFRLIKIIPWGWGQPSIKLWLPDTGTKVGSLLGREVWGGVGWEGCWAGNWQEPGSPLCALNSSAPVSCRGSPLEQGRCWPGRSSVHSPVRAWEHWGHTQTVVTEQNNAISASAFWTMAEQREHVLAF